MENREKEKIFLQEKENNLLDKSTSLFDILESENRGEENNQIKSEIQIPSNDFIREKNQKETQEKIRTEYIPLFEKTYKNLENKEDSSQLQECKRNAKAYIEKGVGEDFERDVNEMEKIGKLSRGARFLFDTSTGKHIKMDREEFRDINWLNKKELETFKKVNNIKKQDMYIRLHIDQWANFGELTDILYKMKIFLDTYIPRDKIRYTIIVSWLRNSEFIEYYRKRLKDNKIIKPSNIIKIYDETKNYLAKQWRFQNMPIEWGYNDFKEQFIIKDKDPTKQTSLNQAVEAYEKEGKKLKEWCVILDLEKIKKMKK